jgi:hypothetical protein
MKVMMRSGKDDPQNCCGKRGFHTVVEKCKLAI